METSVQKALDWFLRHDIDNDEAIDKLITEMKKRIRDEKLERKEVLLDTILEIFPSRSISKMEAFLGTILRVRECPKESYSTFEGEERYSVNELKEVFERAKKIFRKTLRRQK